MSGMPVPLGSLYPEHYRDFSDQTQKAGLSPARPMCVFAAIKGEWLLPKSLFQYGFSEEAGGCGGEDVSAGKHTFMFL